MRTVRWSLVLLLAVGLLLAPSSAALAAKSLPPNEVGVQAYQYLEELAAAPRVAGTDAEMAAAIRISDWFAEAGYSPEMQPFTYEPGGARSSQNVVAFRPAAKKSRSEVTPLVIIGAHYDSYRLGKGADDNASGVAVMLEVAERIAKYKQEYDIAFVAFGAEEAGLRGSEHYVEQMTAGDVDRAIVMINFDSLIVGDKLYIHAGANEQTWARDEMLRLIRLRQLPIEMQPGLHPDYPAGLTPDGFSDYTAFNQAGIPIVAFESTNWEIGDLDGYVQTVLYGSFWHTPDDTLEAIEALYPDRPMIRLDAYTTLVFEFLKHLNP